MAEASRSPGEAGPAGLPSAGEAHYAALPFPLRGGNRTDALIPSEGANGCLSADQRREDRVSVSASALEAAGTNIPEALWQFFWPEETFSRRGRSNLSEITATRPNPRRLFDGSEGEGPSAGRQPRSVT